MTIHDRDHPEKRDFIRMKIDAPVATLLEGDGLSLQGDCLELSGGGLKVEVAEPVAVDTPVRVQVISEYGRGAQLSARARVVRVETHGNRYQLALEIVELLND